MAQISTSVYSSTSSLRQRVAYWSYPTPEWTTTNPWSRTWGRPTCTVHRMVLWTCTHSPLCFPQNSPSLIKLYIYVTTYGLGQPQIMRLILLLKLKPRRTKHGSRWYVEQHSCIGHHPAICLTGPVSTNIKHPHILCIPGKSKNHVTVWACAEARAYFLMDWWGLLRNHIVTRR